jgi:hypothetical protein
LTVTKKLFDRNHQLSQLGLDGWSVLTEMGSWLSTDDKLSAKSDSPDTPPEECYLLRLSPDVWNHALCYYMDAVDYNLLRACGDSRLNLRLFNLSPETIMLDRWCRANAKRSPLVARLIQRATVSVLTHAAPRNGPVEVASDAPFVTLHYNGYLGSFALEKCPRLRSLRLVDTTLSGKVGSFSLFCLIDVLPPTLTELNTTRIRGGVTSGGFAMSRAALSNRVSAKLPCIETLVLPTHPLAPATDKEKCSWPATLTCLSLAFEIDADAQDVGELNLPSALTHLDLWSLANASSNVVGYRGSFKSSLLPPGLLHVWAMSFTIVFDVPLPFGLNSLYCRSTLPTYDKCPFPLPSALTALSPKPAPPLHIYPPLLRMLGYLDNPGLALAPMTSTDIEEWFVYEKNEFNMSVVTKAFTNPTQFDFRSGPAPIDCRIRKELMSKLVKRIGSTVTSVHGVNVPSLVEPVLTHCKWLQHIDLNYPEVVTTFIRVVASGRVKVPHLLETVSLNLDGPTTMTNGIGSLIRECATLSLPTVRTLGLTMDLSRLAGEFLSPQFGRLFPNVELLNLTQVELGHRRNVVLYPSTFDVLLVVMPKVRTLNVRMWHHSCQLSEAAGGFVKKLPAQLVHVHIDSPNQGFGTRDPPLK